VARLVATSATGIEANRTHIWPLGVPSPVQVSTTSSLDPLVTSRTDGAQLRVPVGVVTSSLGAHPPARQATETPPAPTSTSASTP
jgi:hypothetical protein